MLFIITTQILQGSWATCGFIVTFLYSYTSSLTECKQDCALWTDQTLWWLKATVTYWTNVKFYRNKSFTITSQKSNRMMKTNCHRAYSRGTKSTLWWHHNILQKTISDQHQQHHLGPEKMCRKPFSPTCTYCSTCYATIFNDNRGKFVPSNKEKIRRFWTPQTLSTLLTVGTTNYSQKLLHKPQLAT